MNVHSSSDLMSQPQIEPCHPDRRTQILEAAMVCFAKRGFHQASMHDISAEAGISVGLIYRYFENKEAVISAMADRHKKEIQRNAGTRATGADAARVARDFVHSALLRECSRGLLSAFVVDLYAEASRNPHVADLVRDVLKTAMDGVTDLIARSPEAENLRARLDSERIGGTNFRGRSRDADARRFAAARDDCGRTPRATTGSDPQTLAVVV